MSGVLGALAPPALTVAIEGSRSGCLVVRVRGRLDLSTAPELDQVLHPLLIAPPHRLVLDLSELEFLGPHGVAVLNRIRRRLQTATGALTLVGLCAEGARVLQMTEALALFDVRDNLEQALTTGGRDDAEETHVRTK